MFALNTYDAGTIALLVLPLTLLALALALLAAFIWDPKLRGTIAKVWLGVGVAMLCALPYFGLVWSPPERYMGDVYRIMYVHIPHVWMALLGFTLNFGTSISYLFKKSWVTDSLGEAAAAVGLYFGIIGVALGAIWGKPTWGTYWDNDPRLVSSAIMLVIYTGYLTLRRFIEDPEKRATWSAVVGILAYVDIPVVYFSVKWWGSLHQKQSNPSTVNDLMVMTLRWGAITFLYFFMAFIHRRYQLAHATREQEVAPPPEALPARPTQGAHA